MDCRTSGFPVLPYLPEFAHIHVYWVSDAILPSHPLSLPSPFACNLSQHQGLAKLYSFPYSIMEVHCVLTFMFFSTVWERCSHFEMKKISPKDVKQFTQSHSQESWDSIPDLSGGSDSHLQLCLGHQTPAKLEHCAVPQGHRLHYMGTWGFLGLKASDDMKTQQALQQGQRKGQSNQHVPSGSRAQQRSSLIWKSGKHQNHQGYFPK